MTFDAFLHQLPDTDPDETAEWLAWPHGPRGGEGIGGHLSTCASAASLYEVGFNPFFRGKDDGLAGDQIYYQGHAAPGMYSRAYLEGRLTEHQLDNFRQEAGGNGL